MLYKEIYDFIVQLLSYKTYYLKFLISLHTIYKIIKELARKVLSQKLIKKGGYIYDIAFILSALATVNI